MEACLECIDVLQLRHDSLRRQDHAQPRSALLHLCTHGARAPCHALRNGSTQILYNSSLLALSGHEDDVMEPQLGLLTVCGTVKGTMIRSRADPRHADRTF